MTGGNMNSKGLVLQAIRNQETHRVPWVPFVGCHAAKLIDTDCESFFKNPDSIVAGVQAADAFYNPDGLPALFDLQIEAEALGCRLQWAKSNPPSVISHPLEEGLKLRDLKIPTEKDGRFPIVLDAMRRITATVGKEKAIYGLITGPFTLALHLLGTEIFFSMIDEPEQTHELMDFCTEVGIETARMYIDAGCDIIAVVDPMTSQISPDSFAEFVTPYLRRLFDSIHSAGKPGSLFVCGNAKNNIEEMCGCHADSLSIDENIPLDYVRDVCQSHGISFGGNIKLTVTMLFGTPQDNINDAINCMEIGGSKGFILSPGCDMPFDVPIENCQAISAYMHGEFADFMESGSSLEGVEAELPDYKDSKAVYVDVITLDSASCAPCQYMMAAVRLVSAECSDRLVIKEHKIKEKKSIAAMLELGVENIPTIVIDGKIAFVSLIPDHDTLLQTLRQALRAKNLPV
jgi:MtaA/CmuA family methyltransferase